MIGNEFTTVSKGGLASIRVVDKLGRYVYLSKGLSVDDVNRAISQVIKEVSPDELVKLKQLQTVLSARSGVIPIAISNTYDGLLITVATTTPLLNLTKDVIEGLGLSESVVTEMDEVIKLRPQYILEEVVTIP